MISNKCYLGNKGYTVPKKALNNDERRELKNALTVRPYIPKSPIKPPAFSIYRESPNKFYIPRFYGKNEYGKPSLEKISEGDTIDLKFGGSLRDYQEKIVDVYKSTIADKDNGWGGLLEIPCGRGKTVIALNIISQLKKKTLVIVHKNFLLTQWVERIEQFLPGARVGRIQGQVVDIDDKDIVIGMLQSLSMKDYPPEMFSSFGLTIVDETHHIAAEVFVRSLFQVVTKYVLGLSATMQRKDGLTKVFKMFLGDIIYSEKREGDDNVLVKAMTYSTDDVEFNKIKLDYRGNPQYSTMITKLCTFNNRSEFIINIIKDLLKEQTNEQIMILAHNRSLLKYLHDAIDDRDIASVGYYVGGMKEQDLKASESKKIIVATYSMAAEALDIKTLTTLILATPKTDVTQAVGRILRVKHKQPLVVDIIDKHNVFFRQWKKRESFYKKNNYKIIKDGEEVTEAIKRKRKPKKASVTEKKAPINGLPESVNTLLEETAETAGRIPEFDDSLMEDPLRGQCLLSIE